MFDWNDLKVFLAVARHGSTVAAAKVLQINQSTVQRRLAELERCVGQPLVKRHPTGYRLTEFGEGLLTQAGAVGDAVKQLEHQIESLRRDVVGVIRVTGFALNEDALEAHHCLAAKRARGEGAGALEWVGGVAQREAGDAVTADLLYQTAAAAARATGLPPAEGRAAPVADWLIYCDEAGLPREGEA